jgi:hypothetical protein
VQLEFSRPGKPPDNAFAESFNDRFRDECLNQHWFASLEEVRQTIEAWRIEYNTVRPHRALGQQTPAAREAPWVPAQKASGQAFGWTNPGGGSELVGLSEYVDQRMGAGHDRLEAWAARVAGTGRRPPEVRHTNGLAMPHPDMPLLGFDRRF